MNGLGRNHLSRDQMMKGSEASGSFSKGKKETPWVSNQMGTCFYMHLKDNPCNPKFNILKGKELGIW